MGVVHVPDQVAADHLLVSLDRSVLVPPDGADAHVAHPHVDRTELCHRLLGERTNRTGVGDVGPDGGGLAACRPAACRNLFQRLEVSCRHDQMNPTPGEQFGGCLSDAAGGAGDDDARRMGASRWGMGVSS